MGRKKRNWVQGGIYHIIVRGNHQERIFRDDDDYIHLENIISDVHKRYDFDILSYCFMTNHLHLLVQMHEEPLSKIMQLILFSYSKRHNEKYKVQGHLFEERFAAYTVVGRNYLLAASRYIHMNPVVARMVESPENYKYSSYNIFLGRREPPTFVNVGLVLSYFENDVAKYHYFVTRRGSDEFDEMVLKDANGE